MQQFTAMVTGDVIAPNTGSTYSLNLPAAPSGNILTSTHDESLRHSSFGTDVCPNNVQSANVSNEFVHDIADRTSGLEFGVGNVGTKLFSENAYPSLTSFDFNAQSNVRL